MTKKEKAKRYTITRELRDIFETNLLYTVEELSILTRAPVRNIRQRISVMKNPKYCTEYLPLAQVQGEDNKKRWA